MEKVETLNDRLKEVYGIDTITGLPIWRISWSDDQWEWRLSDHTPDGIKLLKPKVQWLPKYKQWIPHTYVLEQLVLIPDISKPELPAEVVSYEPMFPFMDPLMNRIPPTWVLSEFVIQQVLERKGKKPPVYKDPEAGLNTEQLLEQRREKLNELENSLFGDESGLKGKTHLTGEGVVIDNTSYLKEN